METSILVVVIILDCLVGFLATNFNRSFGTYFIISLLLSPLIGLIILLVKGKMTEDEILDNTEHVYFCPNCNRTFKGHMSKPICPNCQNALLETTVLVDDWKKFSDEQKNKMKQNFTVGQFIRGRQATYLQAEAKSVSTNPADEIKKYKDLLDMGAITKEEYEKKKTQLLNQ